MVVPLVALLSVVGLAAIGHRAAPDGASQAGPTGAIVAPSTTRRTTLAELDRSARPKVVPVAPNSIAVAKPRRQTGTDGFLPGLPFDVPPEPTPRRVDRFTIDDIVPSRTAWDTTPPWVRRSAS